MRIINDISHLRKHQVKNYCCIIFIFAGHGTEHDCLLMQKGGQVSIHDNIINPLLPKSSKEIGNTQKVFLIDACRGEKYTSTTYVPRSSNTPSKMASRGGSLLDTVRVAEEGGFLLSYSTMPSYRSFEGFGMSSGGGGAWFSSLAEALQMKEYSGLSLDDLLTETNELMMRKLQGWQHFQQPEKLSRLNKRIFLNPGTNIDAALCNIM